MSSVARLYTPEVLALAVDLSRWPPQEDLPLHGDARSPTCGSTVAMDFALGTDGRIDAIGMRVRACAIGQAAAAIFAREAAGKGLGDVARALEQLESWLGDADAAEAPDPAADLPDWPGLELIAPARGFPGRHGAILLPWRAAMAALSTEPVQS